ncbi:MAG: ribbon-helix-helix protein, CopG family [Verrucomicrobia bacterium]|jgi:metal-responsive CopG/Arc/MetJ family transcriptional regulator|nr:ribbon-helix-helix protein, CopG family [Verrucomicrobiota bacterium]
MKQKNKTHEPASSTVRLSVTVPQRLHSELERLADENDASIAWAIRKAVASYFQSGEPRRQLEGRR